MSRLATKQVKGLPVKSVVNDGTNTFNSSNVLQVSGIIPVDGYVKVTGIATMRLIDVMLNRSHGPFFGKFSSDFGHNFAAGEWSNTELRVYNLGSTQAAGDVKIIYVEEQ